MECLLETWRAKKRRFVSVIMSAARWHVTIPTWFPRRRTEAVCLLLKIPAMQSSGTASPEGPATKSSGDIIFSCTHCAASLVVDEAAAGATLPCQSCQRPTLVPNPALEVAAGNALRISELQHQIRENESQRTEITSYINQHSIQLHRWQLRLKSLNEREQKLKADMAEICGQDLGAEISR